MRYRSLALILFWRTLLGQQVSVAAARTAAARLTMQVDDRLPEPDGSLTHLFPSPAAVAVLPSIAGPRRRAQTIQDTSAAIADGSLIIDQGRRTAELEADLTARPGIGPWTAGYVAMRVIGDPDVLLTGDLVLRQGAAALGLPDDPAGLSARAECWRPFRSYAGLHLWRAAGRAGSRRAAVDHERPSETLDLAKGCA